MDRIVVHQAVYGYRDGHRLLASSLRLPPEAARLLLVLSDRSGPNLPPEFDGYLTGIPLPDAPFYALCRTYEAPELSRPGCVYTHALLIQWADLSRLTDLRVLTDLLKRPRGELREDGELEPIPVEPSTAPAIAWPSTAAAVLLRALYDEAEPALVLTAVSRQEWEPLLIAAWSQMWPRLRRQFRFSTGTMSFRGLVRRGFDVHVVPSSAARRMQGEASNLLWLDLHTQPPRTLLPWQELLQDDLSSVQRTSLRTFLVQHGADMEAQRKTLPLLIDCYRYVAGLVPTDDLVPLVERVAQTFPLGAEAGRLKQTLLGAASLAPDFNRERQKLLCLATTTHPDAFVLTDLEPSARLRQLFASDRAAARYLTAQVASASRRNAHGDSLLADCAQLTEAMDIEPFEREHPGQLNRLLTYNLTLAVHDAAWQGSTSDQENHLHVIAQHPKIPPELLRKILTTVVKNIDPRLVDLTYDLFAAAAVATVLEQAEDSTLRPCWRAALARYAGLLCSWLQSHPLPGPRQGLLVTQVLDPRHEVVLAVSYNTWLSLLERCKSALPRVQLFIVQAFVLALGMQNIQGHGSAVCMVTFPAVWDAVMNSSLPEAAWDKLVPLLQRPGFGDKFSWSRREKVAHLLVDGYVRYGWPLSDFLQTLRPISLLEEVTDSVHKFWAPSHFLYRVWEEIESGRIKATDEQHRLARKWK